MKNYKDTLLMPQTDFPMRGNLGQNEPERHALWDNEAVYEKRLEKNKENTPFVLPDGPPYANGDIHIGHALNKVLKDIIVRDRSMRGYYTRYVPGWDTHGLPIESALVKNKKVDRKQMTVSEFRTACENYALEQIDRQREQFKRLGILGEWENPYMTLDRRYEASQLRVFASMVEQGLIFKGLKPVFWSPSSETALAEAEIEYHDKRSPSITVALDAEKTGAIDTPFAFLIWTTTPWTLPANLAVAVSETLTYVLAKVNGKRVVFADALKDTLARDLGWESLEIIERMPGSALLGMTYKHPLYDRESPIVSGHHVTTESGTGLVHIAPGHGEDDYLIGQQVGLDILCPVDEKGVMTHEAGQYEGLFIDDCSKAVVHDLKASGHLMHFTFVTHSYPHDWRTKQPVIFRATDQWFASIETLKSKMLQAISEVKWVPKWGEIRMENMIKDREAWCISRQRTWGVPIPVFYHEDGTPILDAEVIRHVAGLFETHGSNVWFDREAKALLPAGFEDKKRSPKGQFKKETDILDVWFDSGTSHQGGMVDKGLPYPADLYLEGSDQYRGWFNSSLSTGIALTGKSPYKGVLTHGFVLDGAGRKMSKSIGNVVDPIKVMNQLGADILRLWVASVDYQSDVRISEKMIRQVSETYRKIRNTVRFMLGNLADFDPARDAVEVDSLRDVDRYMMLKIDELTTRVNRSYHAYEYDDVTRLIINFTTRELSAFYLDYAKDVLYIEAKEDPLRRGAQTVIHEALRRMLTLMTPIMPHTTEEAYQHLPGRQEKSVYLENMPEPRFTHDRALVEKYDAFMKLRDRVLKALEEARERKTIGKSLEAEIVLYPGDQAKALLDSIDRLDKLFIVSAVTIAEGKGEYVFDELSIDVRRAKGDTCSRCWHVRTLNDDELCPRCDTVLNG